MCVSPSKESSPTIFGELENQSQDVRLNRSLKALKTVFGRPVQLASAIEVYKIQRAIMFITHIVAKQIPHLKNNWEAFLQRIHGNSCIVKSSYPVRIDTTIACNVLNDRIPQVRYEALNLEDVESRNKFIDFLVEMDTYTFREHHGKPFLNKMLEPKEARALVARDNNRIVGGLWGFFTDYEGKKIFHVWLMVIRPDLSSLGIAKQLIEFAKMECQKYPDVALATLNVDRHNKHAEVLYKKEDFLAVTEHGEKTFMGRSLVSRDQVHLSPKAAQNIVKEYVLRNAYKLSLAYWEGYRQSEKKASQIYWNLYNPDYEVVSLSNDL